MLAPAYTRYFWAKSDRANPQRIHLLEHHMADVGACLEALLAQPTIRQRLARSGGLDDLHAAVRGLLKRTTVSISGYERQNRAYCYTAGKS